MSKRNPYPTNPEVRAWGEKRFGNLPATGPIPKFVIAEWNRTHPKRKYVLEEAHHGTLTGYTYHGCREACCSSVWNAYYAADAAERQAA